MNDFILLLQKHLGFHGSALPESIAKLAATAVLIAAVIVLRKLFMAVAGRMTRNPHKLTIAAGWIGAFAYMAIALIVIRIWFEGLQNFLTFLGIIAVGLTIVSKELLINFVAFWVIIWRDLFTIGERIQVGDITGDVTRKGILYFSVMEVGNWVKADQSTGRIIRVPNSTILITPVANYTRGFKYIWNEIALTLVPEADWKRAREIMTETAAAHTTETGDTPRPPKPVGDEEFIIFRRLTPKVYLSVASNGYTLTLRYLCRPRERRDSTNILLERILDAFKREGIELAFE